MIDITGNFEDMPLTTEQIAALEASPHPSVVPPYRLVKHWPLLPEENHGEESPPIS